jgi:hypothetical protein
LYPSLSGKKDFSQNTHISPIKREQSTLCNFLPHLGQKIGIVRVDSSPTSIQPLIFALVFLSGKFHHKREKDSNYVSIRNTQCSTYETYTMT